MTSPHPAPRKCIGDGDLVLPLICYMLEWEKESRDSAGELIQGWKRGKAGELTNPAIIYPQKYGYELARPSIHLSYDLLEFMVKGLDWQLQNSRVSMIQNNHRISRNSSSEELTEPPYSFQSKILFCFVLLATLLNLFLFWEEFTRAEDRWQRQGDGGGVDEWDWNGCW